MIQEDVKDVVQRALQTGGHDEHDELVIAVKQRDGPVPGQLLSLYDSLPAETDDTMLQVRQRSLLAHDSERNTAHPQHHRQQRSFKGAIEPVLVHLASRHRRSSQQAVIGGT